MSEASQGGAPFREARSNFHKLLASNPNYFGTAPESELSVVESVQFNTGFEELTCIGVWPERDLLEATILIKLPFGFAGDLCTRGSFEYVRFFIDWDSNGDFFGFNEDLGVVAVNVHDIPEVEKFPLCYALAQPFNPLPANCRGPFIVRLRAILSWEVVPTDPNFIPVFGNVLECMVQIRPTAPAP